MGNSDRPVQAAAGLAGSGHETVSPEAKSGDGSFASGVGSAVWDNIAGTGYLLHDALRGPTKPGDTNLAVPQHSATAASALTNLVLGFAGSTYTLASNPSIVGKEIVKAGDTILNGSSYDRGRLGGNLMFFAGTVALTGGGTSAASSLKAESAFARATATTSDALAGTIRATELNAGREGLLLNGAARETAMLSGVRTETSLLSGVARETPLATRIEGVTARAAENMSLRTATADAGWSSRVLPQMTGTATDNLSFLSRVSENGVSADALAGTVRIGETVTERSTLATRLARLTGNVDTPLASTVQDLQQLTPRLRTWENVGATVTDAGEATVTNGGRTILRTGLETGSEGTGLLGAEGRGLLNAEGRGLVNAEGRGLVNAEGRGLLNAGAHVGEDGLLTVQGETDALAALRRTTAGATTDTAGATAVNATSHLGETALGGGNVLETGAGTAGRVETLSLNAAERTAVTTPSTLFENVGRASIETSETTVAAARTSIQDFSTNLGKLLDRTAAESADRPVLQRLVQNAEKLSVDNPTALSSMEAELSQLSPAAQREVAQLLRGVDGSIATARQAQEVVSLGNAAGHSVESFTTQASQLAEKAANTPFKTQLEEIANGAKSLVPGADNAEALSALRTKVMGLTDEGLKNELLAGFDRMTPSLTRAQTAQELAVTATNAVRDVETFSTNASRLATTVAEDGTGVRTQLQNIADGAKNLVPGADNSEVLASLRKSAQAIKNEGVQREVMASLDQLEPALTRTQNLQELTSVARVAGRELESFSTTATRLADVAGAETPAGKALNEIAQGARRIVPGADNSEALSAMRVAARDITEPAVQREVVAALDRLEPTLSRAQSLQDLAVTTRAAATESESFVAATTRLASTEAAAPFSRELETITNSAKRIVPGADNTEALTAMRAAAKDITEPAVQREVLASLDRLEPALGRAQAVQDVVTSARAAGREVETFSSATAALARTETAAPFAEQFETLSNSAKRIVPGADNGEALAAMRKAAADITDPAVARQVSTNVDRMEASLVRAQRVEDAVRLGQAARTEEALATIRATETAGARLTETLNTVATTTEKETAALKGISNTAGGLQYGADNAAAFRNMRQALADLPVESRLPVEQAVTNLERTYGYAQRMEPMTVAARGLEQATTLASDAAATLARTPGGQTSTALAEFRSAVAQVTPAADNTVALAAARNTLSLMSEDLRGALVKPLQNLQDAATIARAETFEFYGPRVAQNVQAIQAGDLSAARIAETQQAISAMRAMAPAGQTATSLGQLSQAVDGVQAANNLRSSLGDLLRDSLTLTGWRTGKQLDLVKDALATGDTQTAQRWADRLVLTGRDLSRVSDGPVKDLLTARQQFWQTQEAIYAAQNSARAAGMLPGVVEGLSPSAREAARQALALRAGAYGMYAGAGLLLPFDAYIGYRGIMNMANDYRVSQGQAPLPVYGQDSLLASRNNNNSASNARSTTNGDTTVATNPLRSAGTTANNPNNADQVTQTVRNAGETNFAPATRSGADTSVTNVAGSNTATTRDAQVVAAMQPTAVGGDVRTTAAGGGTTDSVANYLQMQNNQGALVTQATFGRSESPNPVLMVTSGFSNNPNGAAASWLRLQHANGVYFGPGFSAYPVPEEASQVFAPIQPIRRFSTAETTSITSSRPSTPAFDPIRIRNLFAQQDILASTRGPSGGPLRPGLSTTGGTMPAGSNTYGPSSWDWKQGVVRTSLVDNDKAHHLAQLEQTIEHRDGPGGSAGVSNDPQGGLTVASLAGEPDPTYTAPATVAQNDEDKLREQLTASVKKPGADETLVTQA